jgi:hypothetical protein
MHAIDPYSAPAQLQQAVLVASHDAPVTRKPDWDPVSLPAFCAVAVLLIAARIWLYAHNHRAHDLDQSRPLRRA